MLLDVKDRDAGPWYRLRGVHDARSQTMGLKDRAFYQRLSRYVMNKHSDLHAHFRRMEKDTYRLTPRGTVKHSCSTGTWSKQSAQYLTC